MNLNVNIGRFTQLNPGLKIPGPPKLCRIMSAFRGFLLLIACYLSLVNCLYSASEKADWAKYPKWLKGSSTLGNWMVKANTGTWDGSNWVIKISTEDPSKAFYPGVEYFYLYTTTMPAEVSDQRSANRRINLPILGYDGNLPAGAYDVNLPAGTTYYKLSDGIFWYGNCPVDTGHWEVYDNWGGGDIADSRSGAPQPPVNVSGELVPADSGVQAELSWTAPSWLGNDIKDITSGGGYEIWRSSYSSVFSTVTYSLISIMINPLPPLSYTDTGLKYNTTYYYSLRSFDAYFPPEYSDFSAPSALFSISIPVDVYFNVDTGRGIQGKIYVAGDFTDPTWSDGKILLKDNKNGTWSLKIPYSAVKPLKFIVGKKIQYKYFLDDKSETDMPTASKNREVLLTSTDTVMNDVWNILTVSATPKNLPEDIVTLAAEPSNGAVQIIWDTDPKALDGISGYDIYISTDDSNFAILASSETLASGTSSYMHINLQNGNTYYYKFGIVYKSGNKSGLSDSIWAKPPDQGSAAPMLVECSDASPVNDLKAKTGFNTGEIILSWTAPLPSTALSAANYYIIRMATNPFINIASFKKGKIVGKQKAHYTGTGELGVTVNLGESCPSYYFGVGSVYGSWYAATVSNSALGVAGKVVLSKSGGKSEKMVRTLGGTEASVLERYATRPYIEVKKNAIDIPRAVFVVKNFSEMKNGSDSDIMKKIVSAENPALASQKRSMFVADDFADSGVNSTIFEFSAVNNSGEKLFSDGQNVKLPFVLSIPYDIIDQNGNGIVDSTEGTGREINVSDLRVYYLNEKWNFWQRIKDGKNYTDTDKKAVVAEVKHLSVFRLAASGNAASDLSNVVVFPNPFKPYAGKGETGSYGTGIIFTNLTPTSEIIIYNLAAEVVRKVKLQGITDDEREGKWKWDAKNDDGETVASGVYVFHVSDENIKNGKNKFTGKLCIIR